MALSELLVICPDQREELGHIPRDVSAGELSRLVFDRPDFAVFASMFACLWGEVADKCSGETSLADLCNVCKGFDEAIAAYK
eukprot:6477950-Lingulodinium_polyedra.AAC.1